MNRIIDENKIIKKLTDLDYIQNQTQTIKANSVDIASPPYQSFRIDLIPNKNYVVSYHNPLANSEEHTFVLQGKTKSGNYVTVYYLDNIIGNYVSLPIYGNPLFQEYYFVILTSSGSANTEFQINFSPLDQFWNSRTNLLKINVAQTITAGSFQIENLNIPPFCKFVSIGFGITDASNVNKDYLVQLEVSSTENETLSEFSTRTENISGLTYLNWLVSFFLP